MMNKNSNIGLLILRIGVGGLMLFHGIAKFKGISGIEGMLSNSGLPAFLAYGVYITEIVAPILIIVGIRTRLASITYVIGVLFALFLAHSRDVFSLSPHGGWAVELLGLYLFGGIALYFTGAGNISLSSESKWD